MYHVSLLNSSTSSCFPPLIFWSYQCFIASCLVPELEILDIYVQLRLIFGSSVNLRNIFCVCRTNFMERMVVTFWRIMLCNKIFIVKACIQEWYALNVATFPSNRSIFCSKLLIFGYMSQKWEETGSKDTRIWRYIAANFRRCPNIKTRRYGTQLMI